MILCFEKFLNRTEPTWSEADQNPAILTSTILPGPFLKVFHLLIIVLGPMVHGNLGHSHSVSVVFERIGYALY